MGHPFVVAGLGKARTATANFAFSWALPLALFLEFFDFADDEIALEAA